MVLALYHLTWATITKMTGSPLPPICQLKRFKFGAINPCSKDYSVHEVCNFEVPR